MILLEYLGSLLNWVDLLFAVLVYMHKLIRLLKLSDWLYRVRPEIFVLMYLQVEVLLEHL